MDVLQESEANQIGEHTGAAIAHKGQRNASHGHQPHGHADIFIHLECEPGDDADTDQLSEHVICSAGDQKRSEEKYGKEHQNQRASNKASFFTSNGENKVGLLLRNESTIGLRSAENSLTNQTA